MRIALANCTELPEPDHDEIPLRNALHGRGAIVDVIPWDEPDSLQRIAKFDLVVIRATWNYPWKPTEFEQWLRAVPDTGAVLLNPPRVALGNLHKRYLLHYERAGIPIVPTQWIGRGQKLNALPYPDAVIKPAVSAGSYATRRYRPAEQESGLQFANEWLSQRDMLVQPYLSSVEQGGETSHIFINGQRTHVVHKARRFEGDDESVRRVLEPLDDETALAHRVTEHLSALTPEWLYARVDIVRGDDGKPCLSELELLEPSLFFPLVPEAADRMADAIVERIPRR